MSEALFLQHSTRDPLGRKFDGDNRGPSLSDEVTARGRAAIAYNTGSRSASLNGDPRANETTRHNYDGSTSSKTGKVSYNTNQYDRGSKKVIDLVYSTYNPLTPQSATPAVDVNARFVLDYNATKNTLSAGFTVKADGYPSTESFVEDPSGARLFLGARKEEGSPATRLNGGAEELRFTGNVTIGLDDKSNFKNVTTGSGKNRATMSVEQWNKQVQENFK
jgi:hypothetical protein